MEALDTFRMKFYLRMSSVKWSEDAQVYNVFDWFADFGATYSAATTIALVLVIVYWHYKWNYVNDIAVTELDSPRSPRMGAPYPSHDGEPHFPEGCSLPRMARRGQSPRTRSSWGAAPCGSGTQQPSTNLWNPQPTPWAMDCNEPNSPQVGRQRRWTENLRQTCQSTPYTSNVIRAKPDHFEARGAGCSNQDPPPLSPHLKVLGPKLSAI